MGFGSSCAISGQGLHDCCHGYRPCWENGTKFILRFMSKSESCPWLTCFLCFIAAFRSWTFWWKLIAQLQTLDLLDYWMQIRKDEGRIEKWIMRRAFDTPENPYLPKVWDSVLPFSFPLHTLHQNYICVTFPLIFQFRLVSWTLVSSTVYVFSDY